MVEKRRDSKGKLLKEGKIQRKNDNYAFRYTGIHGKRRSIYAKTIEKLWENARYNAI